MAVHEFVDAGVRNAFARPPVVDADGIERILRRANRRLGRNLGRIEWVGSPAAYIRRSAELMLDGWTVDDESPLTPPERFWSRVDARTVRRLDLLVTFERHFWASERAAHSTARLSRSRRLPVYLNAIEAPDLAADAADSALEADATAAVRPARREHGFAADKYWKSSDPHWVQSQAKANLPFLTEVARAFGEGLFASALLRRGTAARTILIGRPRLRLGRSGTLHAADSPAVVWLDGSERWYWNGIAVPEAIVAARHRAHWPDRRAGREPGSLRRVLARAHRLGALPPDGECGASRSGRLRQALGDHDPPRRRAHPPRRGRQRNRRTGRQLPPLLPPSPASITTAREAVAWTFGFETADDYILAAAS